MRIRWILIVLIVIALLAGYSYWRQAQPADQSVAQRAAAVSDADEPAGDPADQPAADIDELNPEAAEADVLE
ncbi:MAG: hypothetical protein PHX68_03820 [Alphaproteobacteria bacterium]|nr:hypothetical protein [Alphaproteobacteria bacterium]